MANRSYSIVPRFLPRHGSVKEVRLDEGGQVILIKREPVAVKMPAKPVREPAKQGNGR